MILAFDLIIFLIIIWGILLLNPITSHKDTKLLKEIEGSESQTFRFNTSRAYDLIQKQVDVGPRYPGSVGIENTRNLISSELLENDNWDIFYQNFTKKWIDDEIITCVNIICDPINRNGNEQSFLLLAHYDSRLWANEDPNPQKRKSPVPGARRTKEVFMIGIGSLDQDIMLYPKNSLMRIYLSVYYLIWLQVKVLHLSVSKILINMRVN
jgi:hypothetical protein